MMSGKTSDKEIMMFTSFRIVYPRGDQSKLTVANVQDDEISDWALASAQTWPDTDEGEAEANAHCRGLAKRHGKEAVGLPPPLLE